MDFRLTEMQADIANLARDFAEKRLVPTVKERDEKDRRDVDGVRTIRLHLRIRAQMHVLLYRRKPVTKSRFS